MDDLSRPGHRVYAFGGYRLDPLRRVLLGRDGARLCLKPKVFDTLLYLVEHAGKTLDKHTMAEAIWPNVVIEENNLNKNVSVLRRVLGERPGEHRFIVTEPGRGYRFVAHVLPETVGTEILARRDVTNRRPRAGWSTFSVLSGLITVAVVALAITRSARAPVCSRCDFCPRRVANRPCTCEWPRRVS